MSALCLQRVAEWMPPRIPLLLCLLLALAGGIAMAQTAIPEDPGAPLETWSTELDERGEAITAYRADENVLQQQHDGLLALIKAIKAYLLELEPHIETLKKQLEALGPPPGESDAAEPEGVAAERERLNRQFGELVTVVKKAGVLETRALQLIEAIQVHRRDLFTNQLLRRTLSPLNPELWRRVATDAGAGWAELGHLVNDWRSAFGSDLLFAAFVAFVLIVWAVPRWLAQRVIRLRRAPPESDKPAFFVQAGSAVWVGLARMAPMVIAAIAAYVALFWLGNLSPEVHRLWQKILLAVLLFAAISSLTRTFLAPSRPVWRMLPVSDGGARRLTWLVPLMAAFYGINLVWAELNDILIVPLSLTVAQSFLSSMIFSILLVAILLTPLAEPGKVPARGARLWPWWLKVPLWAFAVTIIVTALLGYIAMANFLAAQIVKTGLIAVVAVLFFVAISEFSANLVDARTHAGRWLKGAMKLDEPRRRQIAFAISFVCNLLLILFLAPLFLLQWSFSWSDIQGWLSAAFFGFNLGTVRLSVATLLVAAMLFIVGILLTRVAQRWLDRGPLHIARVQSGVANSIRQAVGYTGFLLSALVAVSYAGFNFTNLAIVAGALSVGIGFGLQSIVNNFVSGLILLAERPIKVGDWVVVGSTEGFVRRISVRATEIETFDRSSVIIPNSELITGTVTNWTHGNTIARIVINVGVSYESDARAVHALLLDIGRKHPKCLERPPTKVVFEDFADSSLNFSMRVYIADIMDTLEVRTDLRLTILDRFREEGIEIPFPQTDLHIKSGLPAPAPAPAPVSEISDS